MSKEVVKLCEMGQMPWLKIEKGHLTEESKRSTDEVFLKLGGKVFFQNVEPMKSRSKCPRHGWSETASELVAFAKKALGRAQIWAAGAGAVEKLVAEIRKVPGFGESAMGSRRPFMYRRLGRLARNHEASIPDYVRW